MLEVQSKNQLNSKKILFQFLSSDYQNGYQNDGWFIDSDGNVMSYSRINNPGDWAFPNEDIYKKCELEKNYAIATEKIHSFDQDITQKLSESIDQIEEENCSELIFCDSDKECNSLYGFSFDEKNNTYKRILIFREGDFEQYNISKKGIELASWFKTFAKEFSIA